MSLNETTTPHICDGIVDLNEKLIAAHDELAYYVPTERRLREALERIVRINGSTGGYKSMVAEFKYIAREALAKPQPVGEMSDGR